MGNFKSKIKKISTILIHIVFITELFAKVPPTPKEGMYPISYIKKAKLKEAGLKINVNQIFNPDSISLINAIVRIGGCTGSFVSDDGLILTNHHCVFGSLKAYSKKGTNYMEAGFAAKSQEEELPMKGLSVKIMIDYKDVSDKVLKEVKEIQNPIEKANLIDKNIKEIEKTYQEKFPNLSIEISEMLVGKSYILFKYQMLKDLRIVYVPARAVGEFGGSKDNWEWPRHSGDFSFVRAYVDKNGQPAPYNINNVPYHPDKYLKVNPNGVNRDDFVFILGYPGRTYRNRSADFLKFMEDFQLPDIEKDFQWQVDQMIKLTKEDEKYKIKYDPKIKSYDNVTKNYRGKMEALKDLNLYEKRKTEEQMILSKFKNYNKDNYLAFSKILTNLDSSYNNIFSIGDKIFWYAILFRSSDLIIAANEIDNLQDQNFEPETVIAKYRKIIRSYDPITDSMFVRKLLLNAKNFKGKNVVEGLFSFFDKKNYEKEVNKFIIQVYKKSILLDTTQLFDIISNKPEKLSNIKDPFIRFWKSIEEDFKKTDSIRNYNFSEIDLLLPQYVDFKMKASEELFLPDANATLRLTYGYVEGYTPFDGAYYYPFTTLSGYKEKAMQPEYSYFEPLVSAIDNLKTSNFMDDTLHDVPICLLYSTDTTGGNSGSPILDAEGKLIGLNFDRTYKATVNDFAWDESYSRSIGVDIRFILWYMKNVSNANYLLKEMNANL